MNVCVVGTGYVGLVTGACLADFGMQVVGVDRDADKIAALQRFEMPIYEPGLTSLVRKNAEEGRLEFTVDLGPALERASVVFIAVGTPSLPDGTADLTFIHQVAEEIGRHLNGYKVIVTKSTVPTGTGQEIERIVRREAGGDSDFAVVSNPEFLREGSAIEDFMRPERVVIGTRDRRAIQMMLDLYSPLRVADVPFVITDVETAELIKYASNAFLATKISFINEIAHLSEKLGADVEVVARGMGLDSRIGPKFLHPGPGFGGSCFPKDARAVAGLARAHGLELRIMEAVLEANDVVQRRMVDIIARAFGSLHGATVGLLGLAFKPETDDIRESAALKIVSGILERGGRVQAYDPAAIEAFRAEFPDIDYRDGPYEAARDADGLVIVTEWNQFRALELGHLRQLLRRPLIVDLRNIYEPAKMAGAGFEYVSVGRRTLTPRRPVPAR